eukprot:CAMPEP_0114586224 /NCGR_PEP_ID=MMETSP0125-20121206/9507_1 /TAXON_ID=485358 ORGANISM="Aristerostoma sp., Strain ATCC 50986" /NCGR_SAMPLE_ID=MMETSP0125 /ASSEMBLY_ACC=CAM_ASM_000245 /LENGTH=70 /DNA_ID=CAMNT_0001781567 /DNA_START=188 /DNA_END=400 /DNA_ORIENTATION=-
MKEELEMEKINKAEINTRIEEYASALNSKKENNSAPKADKTAEQKEKIKMLEKKATEMKKEVESLNEKNK